MPINRRSAGAALVVMCLVGIGFGIWLLHAGFALLGCLWITVFVWNSYRYTLKFVLSGYGTATDTVQQRFTPGQRVLLLILSLLAVGICGIGVYIWYIWPTEWQAGLVFILFGLIVLIPVTISEVRLRRQPRSGGTR